MRFLFHWLAAAVLLAAAGVLPAAERMPPVPPRYFNDYAGVVSSATGDSLNQQLEQYERDSSNQLLVAIYPRMESDSSVEDYTVRLAQSWKVGQAGKNNGAVLFVFKDDHKLYLQVGYGLESRLTDAVAHDIVENVLKPRFRQGNFDAGLREAVGVMIAATKGEYHGNGRTRASENGTDTSSAKVAIFVFLLIVYAVFRLVNRGSRRAYVLGNPLRRSSGALPWVIMNSGRSNNSGSSWGGSGGGGGGFSGGGGSFGGGGAGGSW